MIPGSVAYAGKTFSVTSIGEAAFSNCSGLTSVVIPNSVTSIGDGAFYYCNGLTSVTIPNSVTSIGNDAFYGCRSLTSITIPNSVTSIGSNAFTNCRSLTSVHISNIESWLKISFNSSSSNPLFIAHHLYLESNELKDLVIPQSVSSIGDYALYGCSGLTSVTIPNGVTSIGDYTFYGCTGLTSVTMPSSVTSIGSNAFYGCTGLTSVTIPNSMTSISSSAFCGCTGLTSITIPNSVTSIGDYAFAYCTGLTSITIPNSVTSIGGSGWRNGYAFSGCSSLTSVTIGSGVKNISSGTFSNCPELTTVYCYAEQVPNTNGDAFEGSYIDYVTVYVPASAVENYSTAAPWSGFKHVLAIGSNTQTTSKILYTNDLSTSRGTQMTLPIQLNNTKSIAGFQFDVTLPDGIQYVKYEKTSRISSHSVSTNMLSDNKIRFLVSIIGEQEIAVGTGTVLNLTVSIPATYTAGNYTVTVSNIELTHNEGNNVETINQSDATSKLTVIAAKPGDANGDNKVSVTDVTSIINYILQKIPSTFIFEAADVNGDKKISVTDVTMTINIVLGKTSSNARKRDENNEVEPE